MILKATYSFIRTHEIANDNVYVHTRRQCYTLGTTYLNLPWQSHNFLNILALSASTVPSFVPTIHHFITEVFFHIFPNSFPGYSIVTFNWSIPPWFKGLINIDIITLITKTGHYNHVFPLTSLLQCRKIHGGYPFLVAMPSYFNLYSQHFFLCVHMHECFIITSTVE